MGLFTDSPPPLQIHKYLSRNRLTTRRTLIRVRINLYIRFMFYAWNSGFFI
jgi:hypothetical protein